MSETILPRTVPACHLASAKAALAHLESSWHPGWHYISDLSSASFPAEEPAELWLTEAFSRARSSGEQITLASAGTEESSSGLRSTLASGSLLVMYCIYTQSWLVSTPEKAASAKLSRNSALASVLFPKRRDGIEPPSC